MAQRAYVIRLTSCLVLVGLIISAPGCKADLPATVSPSVQDSAGIRIIHSTAPQWGATQGVQVAEKPALSLGSQAITSGSLDSVYFERVLAVQSAPGDRIVVADAGLHEVMVFDSTGQLLTRLGGRGDGPGEFPNVVGLFICSDSILVASRQHLNWFDSGGAYIRRVAYRDEGPRIVVGTSPDCGRIALQERDSTPPVGEVGTTVERFLWLDPKDGSTQPLATSPMIDVWTRELDGLARPLVLPWGAPVRTRAVRDGHLFVGYGARAQVWRHGADGSKWILRWDQQPTPISAEDRRAYSEHRRAWRVGKPANEPEVDLLFPALDEYPHLKVHRPVFDRIIVASGGEIWLRHPLDGSFGAFDSRLSGLSQGPESWTVLGSDGVWLGQVTMPAGLTLHAVVDKGVLTVATDALGVETVELYTLDEHR